MTAVTAIVPAYNQARHLAACLDSLWFQDCERLEIVVVDDGSPDDTAAVLDAYAAAIAGDDVSYASVYNHGLDRLERVVHPRYPTAGRSLRIVKHPHNMGLAAALNTGVAAGSGEYITYVPADDRLYPNCLSTLAGALEQGADFAYADMHIVDESGRVLREFQLPEYSFERCFCDWYLCGKAKLYRAELHAAHGGYDTGLLAHDHDLFQRFAMAGARFVHVPQTLMAVLDHGESRQTDIHHPASWDRLIGESKQLVLQARAFAAAAR